MPDNLITLRDGTGPSIVFVHPGSGLATAFRRLVPLMNKRSPTFAFENPEPQGAPPSLAELGASYWAQLSVVVGDSLVLVGWSFGGSVAFELATLAERSGRTVSAVVLLDAAAPPLLASAPALTVLDAANLFALSPSELPEGSSPTNDEELLAVLVAALRRYRGMGQIEVGDLRPFIAAYQWHHCVARQPWTPGHRRAPVFLVRAQDEQGWNDAPPDLGWSGVLGSPPTTLWTPGTHHTIMSETNAPRLARLLSLLIADHDRACPN
jgi:thioesterase domain-containing protein